MYLPDCENVVDFKDIGTYIQPIIKVKNTKYFEIFRGLLR